MCGKVLPDQEVQLETLPIHDQWSVPNLRFLVVTPCRLCDKPEPAGIVTSVGFLAEFPQLGLTLEASGCSCPRNRASTLTSLTWQALKNMSLFVRNSTLMHKVQCRLPRELSVLQRGYLCTTHRCAVCYRGCSGVRFLKARNVLQLGNVAIRSC